MEPLTLLNIPHDTSLKIEEDQHGDGVLITSRASILAGIMVQLSYEQTFQLYEWIRKNWQL